MKTIAALILLWYVSGFSDAAPVVIPVRHPIRARRSVINRDSHPFDSEGEVFGRRYERNLLGHVIQGFGGFIHDEDDTEDSTPKDDGHHGLDFLPEINVDLGVDVPPGNPPNVNGLGEVEVKNIVNAVLSVGLGK